MGNSWCFLMLYVPEEIEGATTYVEDGEFSTIIEDEEIIYKVLIDEGSLKSKDTLDFKLKDTIII